MKILAIRHGALGDVIQALGPFQAIRRHHPDAHLVAGLLVATWRVAFFEGYKVADTPGDAAAAGRVFLRLIDRGFQAAAGAAAGTPYVEAR